MMLTANTRKEETTSSGLQPAAEQSCSLFSVDEIQSATDNFDEECCIGRGGFGKVYKGVITDGATNIYAVKWLHSLSDQGAAEFWVEVQMLSRLRHCNLVSLIGYCNDEKEMALVYEYMPHGTLSDHLHKKRTLLTWSQWLKICIGAARGLDYLHTGTGTQHGIIHRDVKSSNILLDSNYAAKISDFGLAKIGPTNQTCTYVSTGVKGTFGYMDPNYFYTGRLTRKSDVYAFGVVLLEVLCGRPAVDSNLDEGLATWAQECIKQGKLTRIIDSSLRDHISRSSLKEFSRIAGRCLFSHPNQRPTMSEVIGSLELALSSQERKDSSAQREAVVKKAWSFRSLKAPFEFKSWGLTRTLESELVTPAIVVLTEDDLHPTRHLVGQDNDSDPLTAIESLQITDDPFAGGELQEVYNTIESEEIYGNQDFEVETMHARETGYSDLLEHRSNFLERRRRITSQVRALQRMGSRSENMSGHERSCVLSGQHRTGQCTCCLNNRDPNDGTNARGSTSRIVLLADALFEVLDEIHQQSVVLSSQPSLSSIGSTPAPVEVVEALPVKLYRKLPKHLNEEDAQCYICLVEYEDGDEVRVLPCHHEFHRLCINKWLKEVHRICPLCHGDVCKSGSVPAESLHL